MKTTMELINELKEQGVQAMELGQHNEYSRIADMVHDLNTALAHGVLHVADNY